MVRDYRVVHAVDPEVNNCLNEFLVVDGARVSEVESKGFEKVGKIFELSDCDFQEEQYWFSKINIVPVGRSKDIDQKVKSNFESRLEKSAASWGCKRGAFNAEQLSEGLASAFPITGKLWLVNYIYRGGNGMAGYKTKSSKELLFIHHDDGELKFQKNSRGRIYLHPVGSSFPQEIDERDLMTYSLNQLYSIRVDDVKIREVGKMAIAPVFLKEMFVSPKGISGHMKIKPHISRYTDFEEYSNKKEKEKN